MDDELKAIQDELDRVIDKLQQMYWENGKTDAKEHAARTLYAYTMRRGTKDNCDLDYDLDSASALVAIAPGGRDGVYDKFLFGDNPSYSGLSCDTRATPEQEEKADFMWALRTIIRAPQFDVPPSKEALAQVYFPILRYLKRQDKYIGEFWTKKAYEHPTKTLDRTFAKRWYAAITVAVLRHDAPKENPASKGASNSVFATAGDRLGMSESSVERAYNELRDDAEFAIKWQSGRLFSSKDDDS